MKALGIDIGSFGIKGSIVDTQKGEILSDRYSTPPLESSAPHKILSQIHQLVNKKFAWDGPVGCAFPAPVSHGIVLSSERIDKAWVDADAAELFSEITGNAVTVINDSDATGLAEMQFGAGQDKEGLVVVLTVGTGIGSSLFINGRLVPNTELGRVEIGGSPVEMTASNKVRKEEGLTAEEWAGRLQKMLEHFEDIFHPEMFIVGGQLSQKAGKVLPYLKVKTTVKAARFLNDASIVGAALVASREQQKIGMDDFIH